MIDYCTSTHITLYSFFFFFNDTATTEIYTLSLHDALPISRTALVGLVGGIEGDGDAVDGRALAHGERLAAALVAQARSHEIEALRVRLAEVREAGLVADDVDPRVGDGLALRVLHVAEHAEAVIDLMLGGGRRGEDEGGDGEACQQTGEDEASRHALSLADRSSEACDGSAPGRGSRRAG